ncbi:hypothetical protein OAT84_02450 [Gammaproteobacteria bacterium]|nr:hypothetical protein [Gammaproteobacteria bacterium]
MKQLKIVDLTNHSFELPWPLLARTRKHKTKTECLLHANLLSLNQHESTVLVPVSFINDELIWQTDLTKEHQSSLESLLITQYKGAKLDHTAPMWEIDSNPSDDYFDLVPTQIDIRYAKKLVDIELGLYASEINVTREKMGSLAIGSVREIKKLHPKVATVYANRADLRVIFNAKSFSQWLDQPQFDVCLIFTPEDENQQRHEITECLLSALENRYAMRVSVISQEGVSVYNSGLFGHCLSKLLSW